MQRAVLISALAALMLLASCNAQRQPAPRSLCAFESGPCRGGFDGSDVSLQITPAPPHAMSELAFIVKATEGVEPYMIDLIMPGMQMGLNRVPLSRGEDGSYTGKGVIPRCPSGGNLWRAEVMMKSGRVVGFDFEVR